MKIYLCFILFIFSSFKDDPACIDMSHTKFISVNCSISDCFRVISKCKFLKYQINIFSREGAELLKFETKTSDIEELNIFMNNLRTTEQLESGTYYAKFSAFQYTDTTVTTFNFGLFKASKIK